MHLSRLLVEKPDSVFELFCPELLSCSVFVFFTLLTTPQSFRFVRYSAFVLAQRSVSTTHAITIAITIYCNFPLFKAYWILWIVTTYKKREIKQHTLLITYTLYTVPTKLSEFSHKTVCHIYRADNSGISRYLLLMLMQRWASLEEKK